MRQSKGQAVDRRAVQSTTPPDKTRRVRIRAPKPKTPGPSKARSKSKSAAPSSQQSNFLPVPQLPSDVSLTANPTKTKLLIRGSKPPVTWADSSAAVATKSKSSSGLERPSYLSPSASGRPSKPARATQSSLSPGKAPIRCYNEDILMPLIDVDESPVNICWRCRYEGPPVLVGEPTKTTHLISAIFCITCLTPLMFLPYWLEWKTSPVLRCKKCGAYQTEPPPRG